MRSMDYDSKTYKYDTVYAILGFIILLALSVFFTIQIYKAFKSVYGTRKENIIKYEKQFVINMQPSNEIFFVTKNPTKESIVLWGSIVSPQFLSVEDLRKKAEDYLANAMKNQDRKRQVEALAILSSASTYEGNPQMAYKYSQQMLHEILSQNMQDKVNWLFVYDKLAETAKMVGDKQTYDKYILKLKEIADEQPDYVNRLDLGIVYLALADDSEEKADFKEALRYAKLAKQNIKQTDTDETLKNERILEIDTYLLYLHSKTDSDWKNMQELEPELLTLASNKYGKHSREYASYLHDIALAYISSGMKNNAMARLKEAKQIMDKKYPKGHPFTKRIERLLRMISES